MIEHIKMPRAEFVQVIEDSIPSLMSAVNAEKLREVGRTAKRVARGSYVLCHGENELCGCPISIALAGSDSTIGDHDPIIGEGDFTQFFDTLTKRSPHYISIIEVTDD